MNDGTDLNPYYGATGFRALQGYFANIMNFTGRTSRAEYWWLLPWWVAYYAFAIVLAGGSHLPQLIVALLVPLVPTAAIRARRFADAGVVWWLGAALTALNAWAFIVEYGFTMNHWSVALWWWTMPLCLLGNLALFVITLLPTPAAPVSSNKAAIAHFRAVHHLSEADLKLFRETVATAKTQIEALAALTQGSRRLGKIEADNRGIASAQQIFAELMQHPHEMMDFADFLYQKLPAFAQAAAREQEINATPIHTQAIKDSLEDIDASIASMSQSITHDYEHIVREDAQDIALTRPGKEDANE